MKLGIATWDGMHDYDALLAIDGDGKWCAADDVRKRIAALESERDALNAEVKRLKGIIHDAAVHVVQSGDLPPWEGALDAGVAAMGRQIDIMRSERDQLRRIAVHTVNETDGVASEDASIGFLCGLPAEVAAIKRERDALKAEVERLRGIAHRSFLSLPTTPGDPLEWCDSNIEPHVIRVADEYRILEAQRDSFKAEVERLRDALAGVK